MAHKCRHFAKGMGHVRFCDNYKRKQKEKPLYDIKIDTLVFDLVIFSYKHNTNNKTNYSNITNTHND